MVTNNDNFEFTLKHICLDRIENFFSKTSFVVNKTFDAYSRRHWTNRMAIKNLCTKKLVIRYGMYGLDSIKPY